MVVFPLPLPPIIAVNELVARSADTFSNRDFHLSPFCALDGRRFFMPSMVYRFRCWRFTEQPRDLMAISTGSTSLNDKWFVWAECMGWSSLIWSSWGALDMEGRDLVEEGFAPMSSFEVDAPMFFSSRVTLVAFDAAVVVVALLVLLLESGGARPASRSFSFSILSMLSQALMPQKLSLQGLMMAELGSSLPMLMPLQVSLHHHRTTILTRLVVKCQ